MTNHYKYPRLYLKSPFRKNEKLELEKGQAHYLINVLRKSDGDVVRVFNSKDGEWLAHLEIISKKSVVLCLQKQTRAQPEGGKAICLYFTPLQKSRMDFLIEKSVELGVTDLFPIITNRTEHRKINDERLEAQIAEASEQCERLDIPVLHPIQKLTDIRQDVRLYACIERDENAPHISSVDTSNAIGFLVGPPGGFDEGERDMMSANEKIESVSLGDNILRAETAAFVCLSHIMAKP